MMRRRIILLSIVTATLSVAAGCILTRGRDMPSGVAEIEHQLAQPGLSLVAIGNYSNDLGERYEDEDHFKDAQRHYTRAVWAYEHHALLTGTEPSMLQDARDNLARVKNR